MSSRQLSAPASDQGFDDFMIDHRATIGSGYTLFNPCDEPLCMAYLTLGSL